MDRTDEVPAGTSTTGPLADRGLIHSVLSWLQVGRRDPGPPRASVTAGPLYAADSTRSAESTGPNVLSGASNGDVATEIASDASPGSLNYRLLIISAVASGVLIVASLAVHSWQVHRLAAGLKEQGIEAHQGGDAEAAVDYLQRYLAVQPGDPEAVVSLAFSIEQTAKSDNARFRALQLFEKIVRDAPDTPGARRKLVDLHIEFGRNQDAINHLEQLLRESPEDPELLRLSGECSERTGQFFEAEEFYRQAIQSSPRDLTNYRRLVSLLGYRLDDQERALEVLNDLVHRNPRIPDGYVLRAQFAQANDHLREARIDGIRAFRIAPDDPQVCALIVDLITAGPWPANPVSREQLRSVLTPAADAENTRQTASLTLVQLDILERRYEQAKQRIQELIAEDPDSHAAQLHYADILTLQGDVEQATAHVAELESQGMRRADLLDFLKARTAIVSGDWSEAARLLERVFSHSAASLALRTRAGLLLAVGWKERGNPRTAHQFYADVLELNPDSTEAIAGLAESSWQRGRYEDAIQLFGRLADEPAALTAIAKIMIEQNRRLPAGRQDWEAVADAVEKASAANPSSAAGVLLSVDLLRAVSRDDEAVAILQQSLQANPADSRLLLSLLDQQMSQQDWEAAAATVDQLDELVDEGNTVLDARIRLAALSEDRQSLDDLRQEVRGLPDDQRLSLLPTLAAAFRRLRDADQEIECWTELAAQRPDDVTPKTALFSIALADGDQDRCRELISEIRAMEGQRGSSWRLAEATRLHALATQGQRRHLDDAREILEELNQSLPESASVKTMLADVCRMAGDPEAALEHYRHVVEQLNPSPHCVLQLADLWYQRGRYSDVSKLIRDFEKSTATGVGPQLARLGTFASLQRNELNEAIQFAELTATSGMDSLQREIWLGHVHQLAGRLHEAEAHFREAVEVAGERPEGWIALVAFLASAERIDEAADAIVQASDTVAAPLADITLAHCCDAAGMTDDAALYYGRVVAGKVGGPWQLTSAIRFYVHQGQHERAREVLQRVLADGTEQGLLRVARRLFADLLVMAGEDYAERQAALHLLEQNLADSSNVANRRDLILKARVLAFSPLAADLRQAVHIYESLRTRRPLVVADGLRLAQMYRELGQPESAVETARRLVAESPRDPRVLMVAIHLMLDLAADDPDLDDWVERLQRLRPDDLETTVLIARWLCVRGRIDDALIALDSVKPEMPKGANHVHGLNSALRLASEAAAISTRLDRRGLVVEADDMAQFVEQLYVDWANHRPQVIPAFARFLASRMRIQEALQLCDTVRGEVADEDLAGTYIQLLTEGQVGDAQYQEIQQWLQQRSDAHPQSAQLLMSLGHAAALSGDYAGALAVYRRVLGIEPDNIEALNEAALLMALRQDDLEQAQELIDRAIRQAGPLGILLDTRSTVELASGHVHEALISAEAAVQEAGTSLRYFHLAQAQLELGESDAARETLTEAIARGLHETIVHPLERPRLEALQTQLQLNR